MEYTGLVYLQNFKLTWSSICFSFCGRDWRDKKTELFPGDKAFCLVFILTIENRSPKDTKLEQAEELDLSRSGAVLECHIVVIEP